MTYSALEKAEVISSVHCWHFLCLIVTKYSSLQLQPHHSGNSYAMWDHTISPATWQRLHSQHYSSQLKLVLDLVTPEGCKAELTSSSNWAWRRVTLLMQRTPLPLCQTYVSVCSSLGSTCVHVWMWCCVSMCMISVWSNPKYQYIVSIRQRSNIHHTARAVATTTVARRLWLLLAQVRHTVKQQLKRTTLE